MGKAKKKDLPNILIFIPDEMRGDAISLGKRLNPIIKTPNIDYLVRNGGAAFTNCFTVNPVCVPSRCCTFTGLYPHNGHRSLYQFLQPYEDDLLKFLKLKGYRVVFGGKNHLYTKSALKKSVTKRMVIDDKLLKKFSKDLFTKDFRNQVIKKIIRRETLNDLFKLYKMARTKVLDYSLLGLPFLKDLLKAQIKLNPFAIDHPLRKSFYFGERSKDQGYDLDAMIIEKSLEYLDSGPKRPFCLVINLYNPHPPYTIEEPYFSMYDRTKIPPPIPSILDDKPEFMRLMHEKYGLNKLTGDDFKEIIATYYGMCTKIDYQFGLILKKLKKMEQYDRTAIFFIADHGDYVGDYGLTEKWPNAFQDSLIKIPLIVKIPNLKPKKEILHQLVQSIDIFPTILDAARIKTPYTHFGISLLPLLRGKTEIHRDFVIAEGGYNPREPQCFEDVAPSPELPLVGIYYDKTNIPVDYPSTVARSVMIRTNEWKLIIRNGKGDELYNLKEDPQELHNLVENENFLNLKADLKETLLRWYLDNSDNPFWERKKFL